MDTITANDDGETPKPTKATFAQSLLLSHASLLMALADGSKRAEEVVGIGSMACDIDIAINSAGEDARKAFRPATLLAKADRVIQENELFAFFRTNEGPFGELYRDHPKAALAMTVKAYESEAPREFAALVDAFGSAKSLWADMASGAIKDNIREVPRHIQGELDRLEAALIAIAPTVDAIRGHHAAVANGVDEADAA